jgi:uncharacterized protein (DUF1697 family)
MMNYVAFLRGINVGGHKTVPMEKLKKAFESLRFKNVQTLLASGNIVFEAPLTSTAGLEKKIEKMLMSVFGHEISVLVRTIEELNRLNESQPFKEIDVTPQTRLYVTFLLEKVKSSLIIPYVSPDKNFRILHASAREVCSALLLSPTSRTVDLMGIIEKEFGHNVTTRNWNTITRILKTQEN